MLLVYNYVLLKVSTWYSKHVEESNSILRINNIQCITLVIIVWSQHGRCVFWERSVREPGVDRRIILKWVLTERRCKGVDWVYLTVDRLFEREGGKSAEGLSASGGWMSSVLFQKVLSQKRYWSMILRCVIPVVLSSNNNKLMVYIYIYIVKNTTIFLVVRLLLIRYNYMFRPSMLAIFRLYMKHLTISYIYEGCNY